MTIDEAIKHTEEVAEKNERRAESVRNRPISSADFYNEEELCSKCAEEHRQLAEWLKDYKRLKESQPCTDAISRSEAIRVASGYCHYTNIPDELAKLPSVTPAQKIGRWIVKEKYHETYGVCSECGTKNYAGYLKFCPSCGAKMKGVEE